MIQIVFVLMVVFESSMALAVTHGNDCRVVTVDQEVNPWEEGLGVFGDPESDSDSQNVNFNYGGSIRVGQRSWKKNKLTIKESDSATEYLIPEESGESVLLRIYPSERGVILYKERSSSSWQTVGTFDCASVVEVEKAVLDSGNIKVLSPVQFKKLPKLVRENLDSVDLAFELGDGYYDLNESKTYEVTSTKGAKTVVGYLLWGSLHYSEDNEDIQAILRFDRNGLRIGEIETSQTTLELKSEGYYYPQKNREVKINFTKLNKELNKLGLDGLPEVVSCQIFPLFFQECNSHFS